MRSTKPKRKPLWLRDDIQFPRLLSEILAVGLTYDEYSRIAASMDLRVADVVELLRRAEVVWERHKARVANVKAGFRR